MTYSPLPLLVLSVTLALGACSDGGDDASDDPSAAPEGNGSILLPTADEDGLRPGEVPPGGTPTDAGSVAPDGSNEPLVLVVADEDASVFADQDLATGGSGDVDDLFDVGGTPDDLFDVDGTPDDLFDVDGTPDGEDTLGTGTTSDDSLFDPDSAGDDALAEVDLDGRTVFVPAIPGDLDAARVLDGLSEALGRTLLDLNARLLGGTALDAQRNDCLGTFDAALGEPPVAVDCAAALVTEPATIQVERGAFFRTEECLAALADGRLDDCVLAFASVFDEVEFVPTSDDTLPEPILGSGVVVSYGLDGPVLSVTSDDQAVMGLFRCEIDVATGATLAGAIGNCDTLLRDVAARFDAASADAL